MALTTTLELLRKNHACAERYAHLLTALGGSVDHNLPINLLTILGTNGPDDVEWVLSEGATVEECDLLYADYEAKRDSLYTDYAAALDLLCADDADCEAKRVPPYADYAAKRVLLLRELLA